MSFSLIYPDLSIYSNNMENIGNRVISPIRKLPKVYVWKKSLQNPHKRRSRRICFYFYYFYFFYILFWTKCSKFPLNLHFILPEKSPILNFFWLILFFRYFLGSVILVAQLLQRWKNPNLFLLFLWKNRTFLPFIPCYVHTFF